MKPVIRLILATILLSAPALAANIRAELPGKWGWKVQRDVGKKHSCEENYHTVTFSPDGKTLIIEFAKALNEDPASRLSVYDVLAEADGILKLSLRGENREDKSGKLVFWHLVMFGQNEYAWNRSDWPTNSFTPVIVRCES